MTTDNGNKEIDNFWATGSWNPSNRYVTYSLNILLKDGTKEAFSGEDVEKVNLDCIRYLLDLYSKKQLQNLQP